MLFVIAILVFVVVTMAVFVTISLFDERKSQARVLRDRLSTVQQPTAEAMPNVALLRDEVLSRIPAFDSFLRRSERVSALQKVLAQGNIDVRAGKRNFPRPSTPWPAPFVPDTPSPPPSR
jgi:hypothetical protein